MKKWKWIVLTLLTVILARVEHTGSRINELEPVETVMITRQNGNIIVQTDTGAMGVGTNLEKAVENLHSSTASVMFLDTAQYLLLSSTTEKMVDEMKEVVRPAVKVCLIRGDADLAEVTAYLRTHPPKVQLKDIRAGETKLQILYYREGRGQLVQ